MKGLESPPHGRKIGQCCLFQKCSCIERHFHFQKPWGSLKDYLTSHCTGAFPLLPIIVVYSRSWRTVLPPTATWITGRPKARPAVYFLLSAQRSMCLSYPRFTLPPSFFILYFKYYFENYMGLEDLLPHSCNKGNNFSLWESWKSKKKTKWFTVLLNQSKPLLIVSFLFLFILNSFILLAP